MSTSKYKINCPTHPDKNKYLVATYTYGILTAIENIHLMGELWENITINSPIPFDEMDIPARTEMYAGMLQITEIASSRTGDKIALFCAAYKEHTGQQYKVLKQDAKAIGQVTLTQDMLKVYFTNTEWWGKQPKGIRNYVSNYNALVQLLSKKVISSEGFPGFHDPLFEKTLSTDRLSAYWSHLRNLGFKPIKLSGKVVDWVKAVTVCILILVLILSSGCMTQKRVARWLKSHPEMSKTDTVFKTQTILRSDTFIIDSDTLSFSFSIDTLLHHGSVSGENDRQTIRIERVETDTVNGIQSPDKTPSNGNQKVKTVRVIASVKQDTFFLQDTLLLEIPIETNTVTVKDITWWQTALMWLGLIGLAVLVVWIVFRTLKKS